MNTAEAVETGIKLARKAGQPAVQLAEQVSASGGR